MRPILATWRERRRVRRSQEAAVECPMCTQPFEPGTGWPTSWGAEACSAECAQRYDDALEGEGGPARSRYRQRRD